MNAEDYENGQEQSSGGQIGPILERKRQEKGLSLKEVEQATMIRTRYLQGLEREDPTMLPDPIYARGFLKTYANFLGLDGDRLSRELGDRRAPRRERQLGAYEGSREGESPLIVTPGGVEGTEHRRIFGVTFVTALAVLVIAVAILGVFFIIGRGSQEEVAESPPAGQEQASPADSPSREDEPAAGGAEEDAPDEVQATVRVVGGSTGMTIRTDGDVAYDQIAQPGFSQTFEAQDVISVSAANGGAVEVEANGENIGRLTNPGQPVTRDFTPRSEGQ